MPPSLKIGKLLGGGLILGYRCSSHCRHCLYGCGPHRRDGEPADDAALEVMLDKLAEHAPQAVYHIAGGEPFLDLERLQKTVSGMTRRGLRIEYAETNAFWVKSREQAEAVLGDLSARGLACVLVSLSPFHAESVPLRRTLDLIQAAERTLARGAFVWLPTMAPYLQEYPDDRPVKLDEVVAEKGDAWALDMAAHYSFVPTARGGRFLHEHGMRIPLEKVLRMETACRAHLQNTTHFHVDCAGKYVPGLCAGLVLDFDEVPGNVDLEKYPILGALVSGGPRELFQLAQQHDFEPHPTYSGPCDLCTHMRFHLFDRGFLELGPEGFYDSRSVPGFV
jgi:hypothetical protein